MDNNHLEYHRQVQERREKNKRVEQDHSKRQLKRNIDKKFNTTIIGILARFEEYFGDLWGHGKEYEDLTEIERDFLKDWKSVRTEVLDHGHHQARAAKQEIDLYTVEFQRYSYQFLNKKEEIIRDE